LVSQPFTSSWTIVSHALSLILRICPHHHTLLYTLFEVVLSYNLIHESSLLLRALLVVAVAPILSHFGPIHPLQDPQHSAYLSILHEKWIYTNHVFSTTLVDVLLSANGGNYHPVWTSKTMARLVSNLIRHEFATSTQIIIGLVTAITSTALQQQRAHKKNIHNTEQLQERLAMWMNMILDSMFAWDPNYEKYSLVKQLLVRLRSLHLHGNITISPDLRDAFLCLETWNLTFSPLHGTTEYGLTTLLPILRASRPRTSTYDHLIALLTASSSDVMQSLQTCGNILQSHGLLRLEASFWGCALGHLDSDPFYAGRDETLRLKVMERVEDAEQRCFGPTCSPDAFSCRLRRKLSREWEWEEMVGGWIQKFDSSPVTKRARISVCTPSSPTRRTCSQPDSTRPLSPCHSTSASEVESDPDDEQIYIHNLYSPCDSKPPARRPPNYRSIIGDALKNHAVVHPEYFGDRIGWSYRDVDLQKLRDSSSDGIEHLSSDQLMLSDDDLNMFMYESSPASRNRI
jgi:hypothetical protein